MVKLKDIYDNVQNPLNDKKFVEKIILAYSKSNRTDVRSPSDLYDFFVHSKKNKDESSFNRKDEEEFYVEAYNDWIKAFLSLKEEDLARLEKSGVNARETQNYLRAFGKVSSMQDISRLIKNPLLDEGERRNGWEINTMSWRHIKSRLIKARQEDSIFVRHRLYIGCQKQDLYKIAKNFKAKCDKRDIPYYFKLSASTKSRDDEMVVYADTSNLADYIEILQEIKRENVEIAGRLEGTPALTGKIDGWIGIGDEPPLDRHGELQSYNGLRAKIFEDGVEEVLLDDILSLKGKEVEAKGEKLSFNKLFIQSATNTILDKFFLNDKNFMKNIKKEEFERLKEAISDNLKKNMSKGLNKLIEVKDKKDELLASNDYDIFTLLKKNGKEVGVNTYTMDKIIKDAVPLISQIDLDFTKKVRETIDKKAKENGIDETFCFQKGSKERFEKEDAKRALESKTREVREEISKKDNGIDEKRIDDKTKTNEGQNRKSIVKKLNPNLMKERVFLPNGRDISAKQYVEEFVLPNLESSDGKVTLKNNNQIPITQYIEEFVLGGGTKSYHGDINALLENTTKKVNTNLIDNRKTKEVNQKEILSASGNNEENKREKPSDIKKQTLEYFRKEKLSQNDDKEKNKESQIDNKLDEAQERI